MPFVAVAFGCFLVLGGLLCRYMHRTAATIAAGEDQLRHLALHDQLSGLPNRTFFGERLAGVIEEVRLTGSLAAVLSITGASIGIALITRQSGEAADIMRYADVALYRAKNDGRNRVCLHDATMDADLRERKQLENDLREAIERRALSLAFQPIVTASGEKTVGSKPYAVGSTHAAARSWHQHSFRSPSTASSSSPWVNGCCGRLAVRRPRGRLSRLRSTSRPCRFADPTSSILSSASSPKPSFQAPDSSLSSPETTLIGNIKDTTAAMQRLRSLGVRFALDDFGTGYSSLLYLRTFPFDKLKIDRSFVGNIESATDAAAIVHAVGSLGRGPGMKVTAEGVATAEQHLFLARLVSTRCRATNSVGRLALRPWRGGSPTRWPARSSLRPVRRSLDKLARGRFDRPLGWSPTVLTRSPHNVIC